MPERKLFGSGLRLGGVPGLPSIEELVSPPPPAAPDPFPDRKQEAQRVVKRLKAIAADHIQAAVRMGANPSELKFALVLDWLREHARGKNPILQPSGDAILDYLHQALIDDLLLEPANILLATSTGPDSIRYDAMDPEFWRECLDLFQSSLSKPQ